MQRLLILEKLVMQRTRIIGNKISPVDTAGKSQDAHITKSFPDTNDKKLRDAVIEMQNNCTKAARQYRFEPATYQGNPFQSN